MDCLGKLHAMMIDSETIHTLIAGDFNCSPGSRFFNEFVSFSDDNNMIMSDINLFSGVYTHISDDSIRMSWVDHVLATSSLDELIGNMSILNDVIISDHKPVSFSLDCKTCINTTADTNTHGCTATWIPNWQHCDENILTNYRYWLDRQQSV